MTRLALPRSLSLPYGWSPPRLRLAPIFVFALATLLLAGATHILVILLIPSFAAGDGWSRLASLSGEGRFAEIEADQMKSGGVVGLDPLFINGACRISLADNPAALTVEARDRFWSLALYDPRGEIIFSLNDRTAIEGRLDMIVVDAAQNARLTDAAAAELEQTIAVESKTEALIALLRLFAPTRGAQEEARSILRQAECVPDASLLPALGSGG